MSAGRRRTCETTPGARPDTVTLVRIQDTARVSQAIQTLGVGRSLDELVDRLYVLSEGSLELDRATLHRIARGKTRVARAIDTPEACIRLYFALMILGSEQDLPLETIVREGRAVLAGLVGDPLATLIVGDLERTLPKLTDLRTLREYLEEGLRIWLPI